jgi:hypothetical protein
MRRDRARFAGGHIEKGERLLCAANMVGDRDDFDVWHHRRKAWIKLTMAALANVFDAGRPAKEFGHAASPARDGGGWHEHLSIEREGLLDAIQVLSAFSRHTQDRA